MTRTHQRNDNAFVVDLEANLVGKRGKTGLSRRTGPLKSYTKPSPVGVYQVMKRKIMIGVALLALVGLAAFVMSPGRRDKRPTAQPPGSEWKLVVTLPATNSGATSSNTNTLPKAK